MSRALISFALLIVAAGAIANTAVAQEGRKGVAASLNPNRYQGSSSTDKAKEAPNPTAKRQQCGLTSQEELLVSELRASLARLDAKAVRITAREAALRALQTDVLAQMNELRALQGQVTDSMAARDERMAAARKARIGQLAGILKKMKPAEAAPIIARQDMDVALGVLEALGNRTAGKILAQLPAKVSVRIAKSLVERPTNISMETP